MKNISEIFSDRLKRNTFYYVICSRLLLPHIPTPLLFLSITIFVILILSFILSFILLF